MTLPLACGGRLTGGVQRHRAGLRFRAPTPPTFVVRSPPSGPVFMMVQVLREWDHPDMETPRCSLGIASKALLYDNGNGRVFY